MNEHTYLISLVRGQGRVIFYENKQRIITFIFFLSTYCY